MRLALLVALALSSAAAAQITVGADLSAGPSLTTLGASGTVEAGGIPLPLGGVNFPTSIGIDARARLDVHGAVWGGRLGVGYLSASDVFDGASLFRQEGVDVAFLLASGEVTVRQPVASGEAVLGLGPELRVVLDEGTTETGLLSLLGDVRQSHLALGASLGVRFRAGGVVIGPEVRGGLALTALSDDRVDLFGGSVQLGGDFRFDHVSLGLTVGLE